MIDTGNLRTASLYINNQLLSRGLLQDGQSIDFANPTKGHADGDFTSTMSRIMSVVNDLILRRDVSDAHHPCIFPNTLTTYSVMLNTASHCPHPCALCAQTI